jgi:hypothetical protein
MVMAIGTANHVVGSSSYDRQYSLEASAFHEASKGTKNTKKKICHENTKTRKKTGVRECGQVAGKKPAASDQNDTWKHKRWDRMCCVSACHSDRRPLRGLVACVKRSGTPD